MPFALRPSVAVAHRRHAPRWPTTGLADPEGEVERLYVLSLGSRDHDVPSAEREELAERIRRAIARGD
jgi:hypothetical protein